MWPHVHDLYCLASGHTQSHTTALAAHQPTRPRFDFHLNLNHAMVMMAILDHTQETNESDVEAILQTSLCISMCETVNRATKGTIHVIIHQLLAPSG